ncbi:MAG TPA: UDP-N-acetylmuramoyl-L-alanyl-D-glutamate--2,6-diaminopimelate ligase [Saprospiraceae bacterium]|nr:UDP-N-acetylmuramoyl-L-alanyl-D-glutamate--2,6-diaminopimelate ligase [Saprospiraceae bacterium]
MKLLSDLLESCDPLKVVGSINIDIKKLDFDSRKVESESLFFAREGTQVDGHQFIPKAIAAGAKAIVCENLPGDLPQGVCFVQVRSTAETMGKMASHFFDHPSEKLRLIGVTGTNGKTTTVTLLYDLFVKLGYKCGLLSTVQNQVAGVTVPATHTTPDVIAINALLQDMVEAGCTYAFMEVSSHAVDQRRIAGLQFRAAVFTNMSHDHLDYHGTFAAYIQAKKRFFDDLPKSAFALVNIDDKRGRVMVQNTKASVQTYSLLKMADFRGKIIENSLLGLHLRLGEQEVYTRLIGGFNAYNLLAAYGVARLMEEEEVAVLQAISSLKAAEGRFDYVREPRKGIIGIVDYAHTPDALEKVLETIRQVKDSKSRIVTVVGCGGDRDRAKRPQMAQIAARNSSQVILTADNPRSEEPDAIIKEMEGGLDEDLKRKTLRITDRRQAIRTACQLAREGDVILVAGKGHEKYQEIKGVKYPFDDKEILKEEFQLDN